jgi:hypothetical protein
VQGIFAHEWCTRQAAKGTPQSSKPALLGADRQQHKWSIPDRRIAMKYLLAVKQGMDPKQWAALHPVE